MVNPSYYRHQATNVRLRYRSTWIIRFTSLEYLIRRLGKMEQRSFGRSGIKVSPLCLGTMQFGWTADEKASFDVLDAAYDAGINFIDTADIYSRWIDGNPGGVAESIIGKWLHKNPEKRSSLLRKSGDGWVRVQMMKGFLVSISSRP